VTGGFRTIPVLTDAEARAAATRVAALRGNWRQRNDTGLYYTIGVVSQEDARDSVEDYCLQAEPSNGILKDHFSEVLESIRRALESFKREKVRLHSRYGLPGVMIYLSPAKPAIVVGNRPHIDLQHRLLDWGAGFDPVSENLVSFTLPLALPRKGAGLRTWPQFRGARSKDSPLVSTNASFLNYEVGMMLCHDGLTPHHGVGMRTDGREEEVRITIQGFGVRVSGEWLLYW
jgi:hypothetical protein